MTLSTPSNLLTWLPSYFKYLTGGKRPALPTNLVPLGAARSDVLQAADTSYKLLNGAQGFADGLDSVMGILTLSILGGFYPTVIAVFPENVARRYERIPFCEKVFQYLLDYAAGGADLPDPSKWEELKGVPHERVTAFDHSLNLMGQTWAEDGPRLPEEIRNGLFKSVATSMGGAFMTARGDFMATVPEVAAPAEPCNKPTREERAEEEEEEAGAEPMPLKKKGRDTGPVREYVDQYLNYLTSDGWDVSPPTFPKGTGYHSGVIKQLVDGAHALLGFPDSEDEDAVDFVRAVVLSDLQYETMPGFAPPTKISVLTAKIAAFLRGDDCKEEDDFFHSREYTSAHGSERTSFRGHLQRCGAEWAMRTGLDVTPPPDTLMLYAAGALEKKLLRLPGVQQITMSPRATVSLEDARNVAARPLLIEAEVLALAARVLHTFNIRERVALIDGFTTELGHDGAAFVEELATEYGNNPPSPNKIRKAVHCWVKEQFQ